MGFDEQQYGAIRDEAVRSAGVVVPLVHEIVRPRYVVDVGAGEGAWAEEFARQDGVEHVWALDASYEQPSSAGRLSRVHIDLEDSPPDRLVPLQEGGDRRFDLAVCMEVAEHLSEWSGNRLVELLTRSADVVLFSAAIPGQGGYGHVNEQWPSYWAHRFAEAAGYAASDTLRWMLWPLDDVAVYYRQNVMLYAPLAKLAALGLPVTGVLPVVHGDQYRYIHGLWRDAEERCAALAARGGCMCSCHPTGDTCSQCCEGAPLVDRPQPV